MKMNSHPFLFDGGSVLFEPLTIFYSKSSIFLSGQRSLLLGRNGSGKSTLVRCLSGIIPEVYKAQVNLKAFINGKDVIQRKNGLGILSQNTEESLLGFPVCEELNYSIQVNSMALEDRKNLIFDTINIDNFMQRSSGELSDGEKQRVSIACVLLHSYHWIILDEWRSHLDDKWVSKINDLIDRLVANFYLSTVELSSSSTNNLEHVYQFETEVIYHKENEFFHDLKSKKQALETLLGFISKNVTRHVSGKILYNKNLRRTAALSRLDHFEIPLGTIGIVIGPNGSGKTTLLKAISAVNRNNKRSKITLVLSNPILQTLGKTIYQLINKVFVHSSRDEIDFISKQISIIIGVPGDTDILELNTAARKLLSIIIACFSPNQFIAIDEPFNGLDSESRAIAFDILNSALSIKQCSILISSPIKMDSELFNSPTVDITLTN